MAWKGFQAGPLLELTPHLVHRYIYVLRLGGLGALGAGGAPRSPLWFGKRLRTFPSLEGGRNPAGLDPPSPGALRRPNAPRGA